MRLEEDMMYVCKPYSRLTVRLLYYIPFSKYGCFISRLFYKHLVYRLVKPRRHILSLHMRFVDTRWVFISPPTSYRKVKLWFEKDAVRNFLKDSALRYKPPIQVERGLGSLSMFRDALIRARERNVKKILYISNFDPFGLLIEAVNIRDMKMGFDRIVLTLEQVQMHNFQQGVEVLDPNVLLNMV